MSARLFSRTTLALHHPAARLAASGLTVVLAATVAVAPLGPSASATPEAAADRASLAVGSAGPVTAVTPASTAAADRAAAAARSSRAAKVRQARALRQSRFTEFTLTSRQTRDMRGIEPSLYRGSYLNKKAEEKRLCILKRESEGQYDVINPTGRYFGAYQVSRELARGATYMMLPEHKKLMGTATAKKVLAKLRAKPMNTWPRYWQDAAFHTVINWEGSLSGASHWAGGRWHC